MTDYRMNRVGFILASRDVPKLASFYHEVLGFEITQVFEDPAYVILTNQGMRLSLTEDGVSGKDLPGFTFRVNSNAAERAACMVIEVSNCDAAHEDLVAKQVKLRSELFRPQWGGARFYCEDPEGNLIEIEELA